MSSVRRRPGYAPGGSGYAPCGPGRPGMGPVLAAKIPEMRSGERTRDMRYFFLNLKRKKNFIIISKNLFLATGCRTTGRNIFIRVNYLSVYVFHCL